MRILYFTRDYTPHDHRFLSALAQTEHEVFYLRLERHGKQLEERPVPMNVQIVSWAGGKSPFQWIALPRLLWSLRQVLKSVRPDLIHSGPLQTVGFLAALSGFRPLVSMSWGSDLLIDAEKTIFLRWITQFVFKHTTIFIGDCEVVRQKAIDFGFPGDKIVTFPWGVDLNHFSPGSETDLRERLGWHDAFVLLHLRSWEPIYGVEIMARAFVAAVYQNPQLRLMLLGDGSLASKLRKIFTQGEVIDKVHFGGQVNHENLPGYYRAADLFISASHSDGSSVSLMEALACATPVLVSDIPGNKEWIVPEKHGWLFPDGNVEALNEGISRSISEKKKLVKMGSAARKLVEERANWDENFNKLLSAYHKALEFSKVDWRLVHK